MELLDTIAADATAIAVLCLALSLQKRATDLVDRDTIRSEARQVESYVDGHAVG